MKHTKLLLACIVVLAAHTASAQDTTAPINFNWQQYCASTTLTYQQMVTTCDSLFSLAGYPVFADTAQLVVDTTGGADTTANTGNGTDTLNGGQEEPDKNPYLDYVRWRDFWSTRLDAATGMLHNFSMDSGFVDYQQKTTTPTVPVGWQFIGPQHISTVTATTPDGGEPAANNTIGARLGKINKIIVNPNNPDEVYAATAWGGLFKTSNASLAPNNTWVNLTDHNWLCPGLGMTDFDVDFTPGQPHRIFCLAGYPDYEMFLYNPARTAGLYCSIDDGVSFHPLPINIEPGNPYPWECCESVNNIKIYPGQSLYGTKWLFITTEYKIIRMDITAAWTTPGAGGYSYIIKDMQHLLPTDGTASYRFRGFGEMSFNISTFYPYPGQLFVATLSNVGQAASNSARLYRVENCNYAWGPITDITADLGTSDYVAGGDFATSPGYGWWTDPINWRWIAANQDMEYTPPATAPYYQSLETAVPGNYDAPTTYNISFQLTLPPNTEVCVILRDAEANLYGQDFGTLGSLFLPADIWAGQESPGSEPGVYKNTGTLTTTATYTFNVTSPSYVNRLIFVAHPPLPGFIYSPTNNIVIAHVHVLVPFQDYIYNFTTSPAAAAANSFYCISGQIYTPPGYSVRKLYTNPGYPGTTITTTSQAIPGTAYWGNVIMAVSPIDANKIYIGGTQSGWTPMLATLNLATGAFSFDATSIANHPDLRSLTVMPNSAGTIDNLYMGGDGGVSFGKYGGPWQTYNGTGLTTSLAKSIGSSIHTGEVSIATADNGILTSNEANFNVWLHPHGADGADVKYGKRYQTRNEQMYGWSSGSSFGFLVFNNIGTPPLTGLPTGAGMGLAVNAQPLAKVVTTYNNEYFGTSSDIYNIKITGTAGSIHQLTASASFLKKPVQGLAPDMCDPNYVAAYVHTRFWDPGNFEYCSNAMAATPTWTQMPNNTGEFIISLAVDPRSPNNSKRLWCGAGWYRPGGVHRVYETVDGGATWKDYSTGLWLATGPVNALVYDEQSHMLLAGTDQGVYERNVDDPSAIWVGIGAGMPASFVTGIDLNRCTGKMYISTFGRGAYEAELPSDMNWNGTLTTGGCLGRADFCDLDIITGTIHDATLWNQDKDEMRTVYVGPGHALIIKNCTINMGRNKNIIVDVGGSLVIEGATITNTCNTMWGTISVLGSGNSPALPQDLSHAHDAVNDATPPYSVPFCSNQGLLKLVNYTGTPYRDPVLENAYLAIIIGDQKYDGTDICDYVAGKEGGLLFADHATFHNCASGVFFEPYNKPSASYMSDCHFLADAPLSNVYFTDHTTTTPRRYGTTQDVNINGNWGISFWNDTFETKDNPAIGFTPDYDLRGIGYLGANAYTSFHGCKFWNLTRGILANASWPLSGFNTQVYNCIFTGNWRALSNGGGNNFIAYDNQFTTGHRPAIYPATVANSSFGIWSIGYTFHVSENTVTSGGFGGDLGIVLAGNPPNTLYRNTINNCYYGIISAGITTCTTGGYQVKCNTLNNTKYGIWFESTVSPDQGSISNMAANRFYSNPLQLDNQIMHWAPPITYGGSPVYVPWPFNYTTYHFDPFQVYSTNIYEVNPHYCPDAPPCPCTTFGVDCCPVLPATVYRVGTGGISVTNAATGLASIEQQISGLQSYLSVGNASGLYSTINNQGETSLEIADALIQAGPYLSDGVLIAAIDRSPALDYSDLKSIILNNSALNFPVLQELALMDSVLNSDTAVINAQNNQSARRLVEGNLIDLNSQRNEYISALSAYYDSVNDWQSASQLFASRRLYDQAFPYYILDSDWTNAQNMIDSINDTLLTTLMTIHLQHVQQGISTDTLSSNDSATIANMSLDRSNAAGEIAYMWYTHAYSLPFFENLQFDSSFNDSASQRMSYQDSVRKNKNINNLDKNAREISLYPNPATNAISVSIDNGPWGAGTTISVSDMYGQKILTMQPPSGSSRAMINTESWNPGIYIFTVQLGNGIIYTSKVAITKT